jgi:hypothetical protein
MYLQHRQEKKIQPPGFRTLPSKEMVCRNRKDGRKKLCRNRRNRKFVRAIVAKNF